MKEPIDIVEFNRDAWNRESKGGGEWSIPVNAEEIAQARQGNWAVILTPTKSVPKAWFDTLKDKQILGLASGGGQQMPILAAAGAIVTCFDNSDEQLAKDQLVAQREGLSITAVQGDMADLAVFGNDQFDLIFHPVSNCFVEDVNRVWQECFRVLKPGGRLLSGFMNPAMYLFDHDKAEATKQLTVEFSIPYSNISAGEQHRCDTVGKGEAIQFSHTLESQIGGQIAAGFTINGFYEDKWTDEATFLNQYMTTSMATLAIKPD
jgi:SAM-dependent methyltransferase